MTVTVEHIEKKINIINLFNKIMVIYKLELSINKELYNKGSISKDLYNKVENKILEKMKVIRKIIAV